jgi:5-methyltetrahydrofolate--homocysteine methyltransferase
VGSLLDPELKEDFSADMKDLYIEMREEHYASLEERKFLTMPQCRDKAMKIDWKNRTLPPPCEPSFLGIRTYNNVPLHDLLPYIDWNPFFSVWQVYMCTCVCVCVCVFVCVCVCDRRRKGRDVRGVF